MANASWTQWKYLIRKCFIASKFGKLSDTTIESKLGNFFPTTDNHRRWKWEITGPSTIVENVFLFGLYRQKHYQIQQARTARQYHSININEYTTQLPTDTVGYPVQPNTQNGNTLTFWRPPPQAVWDLRKKEPTLMDSRPLDQGEIDHMPNKRMIIGVVSK
jgi:hypothetical protein